jgi:hypothetical protein
MMKWLLQGIVTVAAGVAVFAHAESERDRLGAERAAAVAQLAEKERACQAQFVVTPCVEAARREHSRTLKRLHQQQLALDDAERHEAAARRRQAIAERSATQAARASEPAPTTVPRDGPRRPPAPNPPAASGASGFGVERSPSAVAEQRAAEQRNEAAFEARARAAQAHRESVQRRNAQRAASGKVAAPLPVPSGASAP